MVTVASISDRVGDLGGYLREQREHARLSVRQLATLAGVSNPYLSQVERGLRKPSAEVLQQIARGLRISAEALYVRAGILDDEGRPDVEAAVQSDPDLSDRQRRVLLDIYASFRAENRRAAEEPVVVPVRRRSVASTAGRSGARVRTRPAQRRAAAGAAAPADAAATAAPAAEPETAADAAAQPVAPATGRVRSTAKRATPRTAKRTSTRSTRAARKAAAGQAAPSAEGDAPANPAAPAGPADGGENP
jgi:transcriptional regulator with XRE-family HTH domain